MMPDFRFITFQRKHKMSKKLQIHLNENLIYEINRKVSQK